MKIVFAIFLLLSVAYCKAETSPVHKNKNAADSNGVLLVYTGKMGNIGISVRVEIDSIVGVRYEVVFGSANNIKSHLGIFYKFSYPLESVYYNFLTHQSDTLKCCGSLTDHSSNVKAVGTDVINNYTCTHVQVVNNNKRHAQDYWVSAQVPGYELLLKILSNIGPDIIQMFVDGDIFQWGGLVRMIVTSNGQLIGILDLLEADVNMTFPATDFEIPSS